VNDMRLGDLDALKAQFLKDAIRLGGEDDPWSMDAIETEIDSAPTVEAVPVVHARWISHLEDDSIAPPGSCACSNCHHFTRSPLIYVWKYCPNCGARLDGDEDG